MVLVTLVTCWMKGSFSLRPEEETIVGLPKVVMTAYWSSLSV